ncbi:hypothetical protein D3C81_533070 [compost metagenome]
MGDRPLVLLGHQLQGFVERMTGTQRPAHRIQCIGQAFLELGEAFATVAGYLQHRQPERQHGRRDSQPPELAEQPSQDPACQRQDQPKQQYPVGAIVMPGLLDHLCQRLHRRQLLQTGFQR